METTSTPSSTGILPEPTLRRLPWYLAYVSRLDANHVEHVSSTQISQALNVDASQIAKDLSFLNIKGKTRIGYEVSTLHATLTQFLGFKQEHKAIIIGAGSLGGALMHDVGLSQYGLRIVAGFDVNDALVGTSIAGIPIYDVDDTARRVKGTEVAIAIVTVPAEHSQQVTNMAIACGIGAIWNFTPFRIKVPSDVVIANTSIYAHLALIYNRMEVLGEESSTPWRGEAS